MTDPSMIVFSGFGNPPKKRVVVIASRRIRLTPIFEDMKQTKKNCGGKVNETGQKSNFSKMDTKESAAAKLAAMLPILGSVLPMTSATGDHEVYAGRGQVGQHFLKTVQTSNGMASKSCTPIK